MILPNCHSNSDSLSQEVEAEITEKSILYKIPYIVQLLKVKNGKIVLLRDYFPTEILTNISK